MNKKLNILFLASWYPNFESSQAGNFIQQHAYSVSKHVNVAVIHVVPVKEQGKIKITKGWKNNIYEVIVYYHKTTSSLPLFSQYKKIKSRKEAYVTAYNIALKELKHFNLAHLNVVYPAGLFALYLKSKFNLPFILSEHWTAFQNSSNNSFNHIERFLIKKIASKAEIICPVSESLKSEIINFGISNTFKVIPNVVDTSIFKINRKSKNNEKFKLLHVSNLKDEHKNITGILKTIKKLSEKRNDFILTIAGNGDIDKFKSKAKALNIPDEAVQFEGKKTTEQVAELMNESDSFILFSNYETFSVVIAEAWCCGIPVITSKCGGLTENITPENGYQIEVNNNAQLLLKIDLMLSNLSLFNKHEISKLAIEKYSYQKVGTQYLDIYKNISKT